MHREKVDFCMREINAILRSCEVFRRFNPFWVQSQKSMQTCLAQLWLCGLWLQMPWNKPWLHVQNFHRRGQGCYQVDIDVPEVSVYHLYRVLMKGQEWFPWVWKCCPVYSCSSALMKNSCWTCCLTWMHQAWIWICFWKIWKCWFLGKLLPFISSIVHQKLE